MTRNAARPSRRRWLLVGLAGSIAAVLVLAAAGAYTYLAARRKPAAWITLELDFGAAAMERVALIAADVRQALARSAPSCVVRARSCPSLELACVSEPDRLASARYLRSMHPALRLTQATPGQLVASLDDDDLVGALKDSAIKQARVVLRRRAATYGDGHVVPEVLPDGRVRMPVSARAVASVGTARVTAILSRQGTFELRAVDDDSDYFLRLKDRLTAATGVHLRSDYRMRRGRLQTYSELSGASREALEGVLKEVQLTVPLPTQRALRLGTVRSRALGGRARYVAYLVVDPAIFTDPHVEAATVDIDPETRNPYLRLSLDGRGAKIFEDATRAHIGKRLAIIMDGTVDSAPIVQEAIVGGKIRITLSGEPTGSRTGAEVLAHALSAGALPCPVRVTRVTSAMP